jgi:diguanylate cyclase (GGDEF)-like protein
MESERGGRAPTVVLVGSDPAVRRVVRLGLELDGAVVVEGDSVGEALDRATTAGSEVRGVVVDMGVPGEDGIDLRAVEEARRWWPRARVVVLDEHIEGIDPDSLGRKLDLHIPRRGPAVLSAARVLWEEADDLAGLWQELCRWDPMLPPESSPPMAASLIRAVADALSRPQPLGWGVDPVVESAVERFAGESMSVEVAVGELVCLREALRRRIDQVVVPEEREETMDRLSMIIDRAIGVAAAQAARQLEREALVDPLTGLLNRRALDRDLRREFARAARYETAVSIMVIDVDHLKIVNDTEGHSAGDQLLVSLARSFTQVMRSVDAAYRVGGDEFVIMLPEAGTDTAELVAARALAAGAPSFSWGVATYPTDGESVDGLLDLADRRLFDQRRQIRGSAEPESA